ncbi:helix-turn-helix domain-containing protein [Dysgonomonas sp. HDW5B]|uniref:helix-turn-helix domain-containing protein n=1 Tax=Dysgonomonas sp. HDW5B TaxID=2714927 RepID=UPI00140B1731|nr:helix-turn-helix domain-containing protein [Dysgonomonas sp. HDW5B]QIK53783.1 helix-turn-helix domain-containing protein [Dysgonomonas sp. HDW5B]
MEKEFIMIEKDVFNKMLERLAKFERFVNVLYNKYNPNKDTKWLDTKEVCSILCVTPKTLQIYRENGKLGFSQIEGKILYLKSDIQTFLDNNEVTN